MLDLSGNLPELKSTYDFRFPQWVELWKACTDEPTALGLLHWVYRSTIRRNGRDSWFSENGWRDECFLFLVKLAAGHREQGKGTPIRNKAFKILAQDFFKNPNRQDIAYQSKELRDQLFSFFGDGNVVWDAAVLRTDEGWKTHDFALASKYLHEFCDINWRSAENRARVLRIRHQHDALMDILPDSQYGTDDFFKIFSEDSSLLAGLEEMVILEFKTLQEAHLKSSKTVRFCALVRLGVEAYKRKKERECLEAEKKLIEKKLETV